MVFYLYQDLSSLKLPLRREINVIIIGIVAQHFLTIINLLCTVAKSFGCMIGRCAPLPRIVAHLSVSNIQTVAIIAGNWQALLKSAKPGVIFMIFFRVLHLDLGERLLFMLRKI